MSDSYLFCNLQAEHQRAAQKGQAARHLAHSLAAKGGTAGTAGATGTAGAAGAASTAGTAGTTGTAGTAGAAGPGLTKSPPGAACQRLLDEALGFAFRVHQFVGGYDAACVAALEKLQPLWQACRTPAAAPQHPPAHSVALRA